jgi:hypothetical protein
LYGASKVAPDKVLRLTGGWRERQRAEKAAAINGKSKLIDEIKKTWDASGSYADQKKFEDDRRNIFTLPPMRKIGAYTRGNTYKSWMGTRAGDDRLRTAGMVSGGIGLAALIAAGGLAAVPALAEMGIMLPGSLTPNVGTAAFRGGAFGALDFGELVPLTGQLSSSTLSALPTAKKLIWLKRLLAAGGLSAMGYGSGKAIQGSDVAVPANAAKHAKGGVIRGDTHYNNTNSFTINASGNDALDARKIASAINREQLRGTTQLRMQ